MGSTVILPRVSEVPKYKATSGLGNPGSYFLGTVLRVNSGPNVDKLFTLQEGWKQIRI